ncbi:hypothetical protein I3F58_18770 [Streptomyces sp. MUM 203J]|uniref:hypothetical protein n=1 Tax=Streptomyces sp. MUM 203J TaxID=2791990 RepID=UPI001F04CC03|nr:hypothetical protein [Streptomyces sp. MUM 203J]MCH0541566.1 hypothetical protein [Streptomyces sp. MUM 203J]
MPAPLDRLLRCSLAGGRLRAAASAGGLHPVNVHVLLGAGPWALPPGRYAYDPVAHRLRLRGAVDGGAPPGALAVLTVTARRTVSHYGHRAWPLLLLDAGHAAAALALAGAAGWCPDTGGALLSRAAGLPERQGEREHPLAAVRLAPGTAPPPPRRFPAVPMRGSSARGCAAPRTPRFSDSPHVVELGVPPGPEEAARPAPDGRTPGPVPRTRTGQRRGRAETDALHRWAAHPPTTPSPPCPHPAPPVLREAWRVLDGLTAADGTPTWLPTAAPPLDDAALTARRSAAPPFPGVPDQGQLGTLIGIARAAAAHAEGLRWTLIVPGRRLPGLAARAAGQAWLARTGAVLLAHGCPDDAEPARVRRDHLAAGYAVGLAQAAATALGLASRPVGSWQHGSEGPADIVHALALGLPTAAAGPAGPAGGSEAAEAPAPARTAGASAPPRAAGAPGPARPARAVGHPGTAGPARSPELAGGVGALVSAASAGPIVPAGSAEAVRPEGPARGVEARGPAPAAGVPGTARCVEVPLSPRRAQAESAVPPESVGPVRPAEVPGFARAAGPARGGRGPEAESAGPARVPARAAPAAHEGNEPR